MTTKTVGVEKGTITVGGHANWCSQYVSKHGGPSNDWK